MEHGRSMGWLVAVLAAALMVTVVWVQRPKGPDPVEVAAARAGTDVKPVGFSPLAGLGKAMMWMKSEKLPAEMLKPYLDQMASGAAEKFRAAVLAGEVIGDAEREERFSKVEEKLAPDSVLRQDIEMVRMICAEDPIVPDPVRRAEFEKRHGWFAKAVLSRVDPAVDAEFKAVTTAHGVRFIVAAGLFGLWLMLAAVAGIALLIVFLVRTLMGSMHARFVRTPPELGPDRGLWLETFAMFLAGFLAIMGIGELIRGAGAWTVVVKLLMQWMLIGVVFWPRLRGMSWERFRGEIGWHRGKGVWREIGAGVLGYIAGLPVLFAVVFGAAILSQLPELLKKAAGGGGGTPEEPPLPDNKVFDLIAGSSGWVLLLVVSLATVWAPIVEESIFRGALYRHLRGRWGGVLGMIGSVLLVALCFATAHQYPWIGVLAVGTLGAIFGVMREWRGSLIAPMTAHCLHNSVAMALMLSLLPVMRG